MNTLFSIIPTEVDTAFKVTGGPGFTNDTNMYIIPEAPEVVLQIKPPLLPFITDNHLALILPIIVYWSMGLFFHVLNERNMFARYRLHTPEELEKRNKCSLWQVLRAVFIQHSLQTISGILLEMFEPHETTGHEARALWGIEHWFLLNGLLNVKLSKDMSWFVYYVIKPGFKLGVAFFIIDTWQFFLHRYMHMNKFLYKHLHSVHHRLFVPYAFGALYNSVLEGFLLDTLGTGVAHLVTGLTARESVILYVFSTMKTVDDHCGYALPWDPFQLLFPNNAIYHDIHHQHFGIKTNFSQPFFIFWDKLFGTRYTQMDEYVAKQHEIREAKYREHLEQQREEREKKEQ
ncbi:uncharacterized protein SAPINGB_P006275 [Magnusiomyces paraingens]|uniref:Fatty acid hydroxylase domain-containing protein n=1 Tax=Magnusiomyces paraingens TaxID=2606893 RepID=A0A5E8C636_9ASCO|nr:uncharacterized protein SAPINGB_P006275 [Saprochaete ingens]VVT58570.1 unnamed protein product [Saprochaete ingens]